MCKLVAYLNLETDNKKYDNYSKYTKMFKHLLYINSFGNSDGTGVMQMTSDGKTYMYKRGIPSPDFLQLKAGKAITDINKKTRFIVGHTRYGTVGGISDENSHPFLHGNIMLVQNGTSEYAYRELLKGNEGIEVDSEAVCYSINKNGVEKTFEEYQGSGVFMWFNTKDKTFNLLKNFERTLFCGKIIGKDIYFITTDVHALDYTAKRAGVALEYIEEVDNGVLLTYDLEGNFTEKELLVIPECVYQPLFSFSKDKITGEKSSKLCCDICEGDINKGEKYYLLEDYSIFCGPCSEWALDTYSIQEPKERIA